MTAALRLGALLSCSVALTPALARAQAQPATISESLFQDARALMAKGDYEAACPKLAESHRLDPATGTLLALAVCYEQQGKLASAWSTYSAVAVAAQRDRRPDRAAAAAARARALRPTLSTLAIRLSPETAALAGVKVSLDRVAIGAATLSEPLRVDGGEHVVEATADGRRPYRTVVTVDKAKDAKVVSIPVLDPAPPSPSVESARRASGPVALAPSAPRSPPPADAEGGAWKRPAAYTAASVSLVGIGVGSYFGVRAIQWSADARTLCGESGPCADPTARRSAEDARAVATVSTVTFSIAAAAAIFGAWAYFTAPPSRRAPGAEARPWIRATASGLAGAW